MVNQKLGFITVAICFGYITTLTGLMVDMAPLCSASFGICTAQRLHVHGEHVMHLCSEMLLCDSNAFIIPKIFISYDFYVISDRKSCENGLILLTVDMSPLCSKQSIPSYSLVPKFVTLNDLEPQYVAAMSAMAKFL